MFTALRKSSLQSRSHSLRSTALLMAVLVLANVVAILGLGAAAQAGDFPDALRYAPMTWEKKAPVMHQAPQAETAAATNAASAVRPLLRDEIDTATTATVRNFVEIRSEASPSTKAVALSAERHHRFLLIALMSAALATMAGVSALMFRSLAREISETERRRRSW